MATTTRRRALRRRLRSVSRAVRKARAAGEEQRVERLTERRTRIRGRLRPPRRSVARIGAPGVAVAPPTEVTPPTQISPPVQVATAPGAPAPIVPPTPAQLAAEARGPLPGEIEPAAPVEVISPVQIRRPRRIPLRTKEDIMQLEQTNPQFSEAITNFREENPNLDIDFNNRTLNRRIEREIRIAERKGEDPGERLEKLFENERFQIQRPTEQIRNTELDFQTKEGATSNLELPQLPEDDFNAPEILTEFIGKDSEQLYAEIQKNPDKFAEMFSGDYVSEMLGVNLTVDAINDAETQILLRSEKAMFENFAAQHEAVIKQDLADDIKLIDEIKIIDKMKTDISKTRLSAQKEDVLGELRETRSRLESYLKVKMNVEGLTSSASGLSLLVSKVTAFDKMVANTELEFSLALQELDIGLQERSLQYTAQILSSNREARSNLLRIDETLAARKSEIDRSRLLNSQERRLAVLSAVGGAMQEKQRIKEATRQQQIDVWKEVNRTNEVALDRAFDENQKELDRQLKRDLAEEKASKLGSSRMRGLAKPQSLVYDFSETPVGGITIAVAEGARAGQCGRFVNDVLGAKIFGDDFEQKRSMINSEIPIPGAAFIMKTDTQWGHIGIVESVNPDGSISVVESNYNNIASPETISRRVIRPGTPEFNAIVGYHLPQNSITEKDVMLSQIRNGNVTNKDVSGFREVAANEGWLGELNTVLNDPKNKPISEKQATRFSVDSTLNKRKLVELIEKREEIGFGNQSFQGLGKDIEGFNSFLELGRRLTEARQLFDEFKKAGFSLRSGFSKTRRTADRATELLGGDAEENLDLFRKIEAITGEQLALFVKEISGAAVSEQEFQRLQRFKPNVNMADSTFEDQLQRMQDDYQKSVEFKMSKYNFASEDAMLNAVRNFGSMPNNLGDVISGPGIFEQLGFDDSTELTYSNIFSPIR